MKLFVLAAAMAAFAAPAFADGWTATPVHTTASTSFVAGGVVWSCDSSGCRSTSDTTSADPMHSCVELVQVVGPVGACVPDNAPYSASKLTRCNGSAK